MKATGARSEVWFGFCSNVKLWIDASRLPPSECELYIGQLRANSFCRSASLLPSRHTLIVWGTRHSKVWLQLCNIQVLLTSTHHLIHLAGSCSIPPPPTALSTEKIISHAPEQHPWPVAERSRSFRSISSEDPLKLFHLRLVQISLTDKRSLHAGRLGTVSSTRGG